MVSPMTLLLFVFGWEEREGKEREGKGRGQRKEVLRHGFEAICVNKTLFAAF